MLIYYGVREYGKKAVWSRSGVCENCSSHTVLTTYMTSQFIHLYFIPLIPAGSKIKLNYCPECGHQSVFNTSKFKRMKKREVQKALESFESSSKYGEVPEIIQGLKTLRLYDEFKLFDEVIEKYYFRHIENTELQKTMAYGYYFFGQFDKALSICNKIMSFDNEENLTDLIEDIKEKKGQSFEKPETAGKKSINSYFLPYLVPLSIVLTAFVLLFLKGYNAGVSREAWLVNGSQTSYSIMLAGQKYDLEPYESQKITIPMGRHDVEIIDSFYPIPPSYFEYYLPFWKRIFDNSTFVINPDKLALFYEENIPYTVEATDEYEIEYNYLYGSDWYKLSGIDYVFEEAPDEVSMGASERVRYKKGLQLYTPQSYFDTLNFISSEDNETAVEDLYFTILSLHPESDDAMFLLSMLSQTDRIRDILEKGLEYSPLLIDWHRFYQGYIETVDPDIDLEKKYSSLVSEHPEISAYKYLLGRIMADDSQAVRLFLESEENNSVNGYGYNALAYNQLIRGNYSEALKYADMAVNRNPDYANFQYNQYESLLALGQYDRLLTSLQTDKELNPYDGSLVVLELKYRILSGDIESSNDVIDAYVDFNKGEMSDRDIRAWKLFFNGIISYMNNDLPSYYKFLEAAEIEGIELEKSLYQQDLDTAWDYISTYEYQNYLSYLLLYCAAKYGEDSDIAAKSMKKALELIKENQQLTSIFKVSSSEAIEDINRLELYPLDKRVIACTLGFMHDRHKSDFFNISRKFNYTREYPYRLLNLWMGVEP